MLIALERILMKTFMGVVIVLVLASLDFSRAQAAAVEPVGKVTGGVGAENESGTPAGARVGLQLLGVVPLGQQFGFQGMSDYLGGRGSRFGLSAGPLFGWDSGKAALFTGYEYRSFDSNNFVFLNPAVAFYLPQSNINLWYAHPLSSPQRDGLCKETGINRLQASVSYFPDRDIASFARKDNVELTVGVQGNSFGGVGSGDIQNGVGPLLGLSFMPVQDVRVNLLRGSVDHHGRYQVMTGIAFYFNKAPATLLQLRRRYLEPEPDELYNVGRVCRSGGALSLPAPLPGGGGGA
jgi:hypothetical protein